MWTVSIKMADFTMMLIGCAEWYIITVIDHANTQYIIFVMLAILTLDIFMLFRLVSLDDQLHSLVLESVILNTKLLLLWKSGTKRCLNLVSLHYIIDAALYTTWLLMSSDKYTTCPLRSSDKYTTNADTQMDSTST